MFAAGPELVLKITGMAMHRGCIASFDRRPVPSPAEVLVHATRVVVLENLNNPTNLGVIARSAVALGADALILDPSCCDPLYRRASRVAMGEVFGLPYAYAPRFPAGLDVVIDAGFSLLALTPDPAAESIDDLSFGPDERIALVLGAEGPGLSEDTLARVGPAGPHPDPRRRRLPERGCGRRHRLLRARTRTVVTVSHRRHRPPIRPRRSWPGWRRATGPAGPQHRLAPPSDRAVAFLAGGHRACWRCCSAWPPGADRSPAP